MNQDMLAQKRIVITGAGRGMGRALAVDFARAGAEHLALIDINADALDSVAEEIGSASSSVSTHAIDLRDGTKINSAVADVLTKAGGVDVLVNVAGVLDHLFTSPSEVAVDTLSETAWDAVMDINLKAPWLMIKACSPALLESDRGPAIINFGSVAGMYGTGMAAYSVSKAAVLQLSRVAAINLSPKVRVNSISPGSIRTPMSQSHLDAGEDRQERALTMYGTNLIPRLGHTSEISAAAIFLASDASSFITGVNLPVDGGTTAWRGRQTHVPLNEVN